jgi:hypothetical protein
LVENINASDKLSACIIRVELQQDRGSGADTGREAKNWGLGAKQWELMTIEMALTPVY